MDEYILKSKAVSRANWYHIPTESLDVRTTLDYVVNSLLNIPAADVAPIRHGQWIVKGQDIYCSECNAESAYNPFGASKFSVYCPTCGALMDKRGDRET